MTVVWESAGSSETFDTSPYNDIITSNGSVASSATNPHGQQRAVRCTANSGGTNRKASFGSNPSVQDAGTRVTFYHRFDALPTAFAANNTQCNSLFLVLTSGGSTCWVLGLDTSGKLRLLDKNFASQATGTTTMAINTLHRISLAWTVTSAAVNTITVFVDGVQELSVTNITVTISGVRPAFGPTFWDATSASSNHDYTDLYIDDSSALTDPGDIRVTAKRPASSGTANSWTTQIGAGGSGVGTGHSPQVNERPLSQTNGWSVTPSGSTLTEEYNIEGPTAGDQDLTAQHIVGVMGWVFTKGATPLTVSIIVDGTLTSITITTTATFFRQLSPNPTTYPAGTGTDIGMRSTTSANLHSLYECGILVAYMANATEPQLERAFRGITRGVGRGSY